MPDNVSNKTPTDDNHIPAWWTPAKLAKHYDVSKRTIYRAIESGEIVHAKIGGCIRVSDAERIAWEIRQTKSKAGLPIQPIIVPHVMSRAKREAARQLGLL